MSTPARQRTSRTRLNAAAAPVQARGIDSAGPSMGNRALAQWLARDATPSLEAEADRAATAVTAGAPAPRSTADDGSGAGGRPLDGATRAHFEGAFGQDLSGVRLHDDAATHQRLQGAHAHALTEGEHIGFAPGTYRPDTPGGQHRLAHELAHVVQQRGGAAGGGGRPALSATAVGPQADSNRDALTLRLQAVQKQLASLRKQYNALNDEFTDSVMSDRLEESLRKGTAGLHSQARSEKAASALWGGTHAIKSIKRGASATVSGNDVTINAKLQICYLALKDNDAQAKAAADIPRIDKAIRDVWQVQIESGEYAGVNFRLVPRITWRAKKDKAAEDAFQIEVRAADKEPSVGDSVHGTISLAPAHLDGARVIVVAHELAHVFGFVDAYLTMEIPASKGKPASEQWSVARGDPNPEKNRPDLLGMIDPSKLEELRKKGSITEDAFKRQSGTVRIWEEDASIVLRTFGVNPPPPKPLTPDDEEFDYGADLHKRKREGEEKLAKVQKKRRRVDNAMESLDLAEQIMKLEAEAKDLNKRLGTTP